MTVLCAQLVESILEALEEEGQVTIIGNPSRYRDRVAKDVIAEACRVYSEVAVVDWYGAYRADELPTAEPALPYSEVAKYLPLAVASMPGLYRLGYRVEGLVYEVIEASESFSQVISRLRALSGRSSLARTILFRIDSLKDYFTEENVKLPERFSVNLRGTPLLVKRVLSQLWIAFACEALLSQGALLVVSEASRAIKRSPWVWSLIDEAEVRGVRVLLVDSQLLRVYLRHALVFTDFRPEESPTAHKYRLQALSEGWGRGKALLIRSPNEHHTFKID